MGDDGDRDDGRSSARHTAQVANTSEARDYIRDFLDDEYITDLQAVLRSAEQVTNKEWSVVVTAEGFGIAEKDED